MHVPEAKELFIVMVGKFNPVIINPNWLVGKGLINDLEAKEATGKEDFITHPEISQFQLSFCNIQVSQERYIISSPQEGYFDQVRALTAEIFDFLRETPIYQIGINTIHHYRLSGIEEWENFGDTLAPKEIWNSI